MKKTKTTNYPIGDFLTRIKNASMGNKKTFEVKATNLIKSVASALKKQGYLSEVKENKGELEISLSYQSKKPVLLDIKTVSKPGLRVYMSVDELESKKGPSIYIISTPKGIKTDKEAIKERIGGEVIAEVW